MKTPASSIRPLPGPSGEQASGSPRTLAWSLRKAREGSSSERGTGPLTGAPSLASSIGESNRCGVQIGTQNPTGSYEDRIAAMVTAESPGGKGCNGTTPVSRRRQHGKRHRRPPDRLPDCSQL